MRPASAATALRAACLLLLVASCQGHAAPPVAAAAAASSAWRASSSLGALRLQASQRARARQLSAFTARSVGRPAPALLPYPREALAVRRYLADALAEGPQVIPTWFVVVTDPGNARATNITVAQAAAQVNLLNRAFATGLPSAGDAISSGAVVTEAGSPAARLAAGASDWQAGRWRPGQALWQFKLAGVRYVTSGSPMCVGSNAEQALKAYWRPRLAAEGGAPSDRTLVVYASDIAAGCKGPAGYAKLFGFSNSPQDLVFWKHNSMAHRDGVVVDFKYLHDAGSSNLEGGSGALHGAASGAQLVHEIGHWMGLVHTFEGGCSASAAATDQVDDTPAEAHPLQWGGGVDMRDASGGCRPRDSCPGQPGDDLYSNWMDYNNLACARSFTSGQQARMLYMFRVVRRQ